VVILELLFYVVIYLNFWVFTMLFNCSYFWFFFHLHLQPTVAFDFYVIRLLYTMLITHIYSQLSFILWFPLDSFGFLFYFYIWLWVSIYFSLFCYVPCSFFSVLFFKCSWIRGLIPNPAKGGRNVMTQFEFIHVCEIGHRRAVGKRTWPKRSSAYMRHFTHPTFEESA
jgi:hypothetical protein